MRIVAFTRYGPRAASTRQRFVQYFPALHDAGFCIEHHALLGDDYVASLSSGEPYPKRKVANAYAKRLAQLPRARRADLVWIYAELLPYAPALIERLATAGKAVVYDFDDAFFHSREGSGNALVRSLFGDKYARLIAHADACVCGNTYLLDYAVRYCANSVVIPTVVDTSRYTPAPTEAARPLTIGWIGSPSTWTNVRPLLPALRDLASSHGMRVRAVGAGRSAEADRFPGLELVDWSESTEIAEVQSMDIGIMPLLDLPFQRGKSGYKLIQYMACGLPVVASPIGVNAEIVKDGINGFLASSEGEWRAALESLAESARLREALGAEGREQVVRYFSLASKAPMLVELFRDLTGGRRTA
jgi:glycosyltransferase involved in cell wall biosynthesis